MTRRVLSADDVPFADSERDRFERIAEGHYLLSFPDLNTDLEIDYLRRERYQLHGELTVHTGLSGARTVNGVLLHASINLSSPRERDALAKTLLERTQTAPEDMRKWRAAVDELSIRANEAERNGAPAVILSDVQQRGEQRWFRALGFQLPEAAPAMIFSDGDTLKTFTADALAVELARQGINVGLLDWEMTEHEHAERARLLCGVASVPTNLVYLSCTRPLIYERDRVAQMIHEHQVKYLICDSVAFACHDKPESADAALAYFREVRRFGLGSFHIAHTTKGDQSDQKPFGSSFWFNGVRALWYAKRAEPGPDARVTEVGYYPRKFNFGSRPRALALRFMFTEHVVSVEPVEAAAIESLASGLKIADRMKHLLRKGSRTVEDIAAELNAKPASVKKALERDAEAQSKGKVAWFSRMPGPDGERIGLAETKFGR